LQLISSEIIKAPVAEDESGKRTAAVLKVLPLMLGWFALNVPAGLALYWLSNTVLTTATQVRARGAGAVLVVQHRPHHCHPGAPQ
jgi:YidC/Oxa1 family membrane protein insertase